MALPKVNLKFTRDSRGVWCAGGYHILGPNSDIAKMTGGYSYWNLVTPNAEHEYEIFHTKRDAVAAAKMHSKGDKSWRGRR